MPTLIAIASTPESMAPMVEAPAASITPDAGVVGDARGAPGPRQVTVLSQDAWARACADLDAQVPWTYRRANLLIEGVDLEGTTGRRLRVGGAVLEITGETKPCGTMDAQHAGLTRALVPEWRGGVTCRVISGADVSIGDDVAFD